MNLSASTWNYVREQWHYPVSIGGKKAACHLKLIEFGVNFLHKSMIASAALVAAIATPILLLLDLCSIPFSSLKNVKVAASVLDFYQGSQPNDKGVTLEEIWNWDNPRLEAQHDYIQWLFPLKTQGVNPTAALTDDATIAAFKNDKVLQDKMVRSFDLMLEFYGFTRSNSSIQIGPNFTQYAKNWLNLSNHNYQRITRILTALRLHGLDHLNQAFFKVLKQVYQSHRNEIGSKAFSYWESAAKSPGVVQNLFSLFN